MGAANYLDYTTKLKVGQHEPPMITHSNHQGGYHPLADYMQNAPVLSCPMYDAHFYLVELHGPELPAFGVGILALDQLVLYIYDISSYVD